MAAKIFARSTVRGRPHRAASASPDRSCRPRPEIVVGRDTPTHRCRDPGVGYPLRSQQHNPGAPPALPTSSQTATTPLTVAGHSHAIPKPRQPCNIFSGQSVKLLWARRPGGTIRQLSQSPRIRVKWRSRSSYLRQLTPPSFLPGVASVRPIKVSRQRSGTHYSSAGPDGG